MFYDCCLHINLMQDISVGMKIVLAFQTLVVFGDVGTSPLYTFNVMFRKAPINENETLLEHYHLCCIF
jgi:K+ transporter